MTIKWITSKLGTGPFGVDELPADAVCVDIRALVDRGGNASVLLQEYVRKALVALEQGHSVVICCDHGISRSNALAVAVLSQYKKITISEAIHEVLLATDNAEIRLEVLDSVRLAQASTEQAPPLAQRWLLTGASGYLGSAISENAPANIELLCPSHAELDLTKGGPSIDLFVRENRVSRILHFANPHVGNTNSSFGETLVALRNVLDTCVSNNLPLFFPSRWEVFSGYKGADTFANENTSLKPAGVLGDTKFLSEILIETNVRRSGLRALVLRSGLVYGGVSAPNFIRSFIKRVVKGENLNTHMYFNGEPKLDLIHLDDWVRACWTLLKNDLDGIYHCGTSVLIGTSEIAKMVIDSLDGTSNIQQIDIQDEFANIALESHKLEAVGWEAEINPRNGIPAFVKSYCKN